MVMATEGEYKPPLPINVSDSFRIPLIDFCVTCDAKIEIPKGEPYPKPGEIHPGIGPHHHLTVYPDHYVISVRGELAVWRQHPYWPEPQE
jgi:hypothetical protein